MAIERSYVRHLTRVLAATALALAVAASSGACGSFGSTAVDPPAAGDAGDAGDAAVDARASKDPGVFCNTNPPTYCNPVTEVCCGSSTSIACVPRQNAGQCSGVDGCDDGADCAHLANGVCCGSLGSDDLSIQGTDCTTRTDCPKRSFWAIVCDPSAPQPCPEGQACAIPDGGNFALCAGLRY